MRLTFEVVASKYYNNNVTKDNLELLGDVVVRESEKTRRRHQDLEILNICGDLIRQNNIRRSVIVSKNSLRVLNSKGPSHTNEI